MAKIARFRQGFLLSARFVGVGGTYVVPGYCRLDNTMRVYFLWNFSEQGWVWYDLKRGEWRLRPCPYRATQFSDFEEMAVAKKAFPDDYLIEVATEVEIDWPTLCGKVGM